MKKTILVTGGAGYIGSHFVNRLKNEPDVNIVIVDNFSQGKNNIIKAGNIYYKKADICDRKALQKIFKSYPIDIVVHYAALASVPDSVARPEAYYKNNILGGLNLLAAMAENGVKKIIFSSSASVYGEPQTDIISEGHGTNPINPYGYTKLVFENILKDYHRAYGLESISFRYFCAAGCDESLAIGEFHKPETHIIPCLIETVLGKREKFFVYGNDFKTPDGTGVRDYIHVNDLAGAHLLAVKKLLGSEKICSVYNLGINKGFSVLELIKATEKISGKKVNFAYADRRPGDPSILVADATKAGQELGWKPRYLTIEGIIESAYTFYRKNT